MKGAGRVRVVVCHAVFLSLAVLCVSCGGGSSSSQQSTATTTSSSGDNVQPIVVNSGPAGNYANGVFTSVTVCVPSSSTCQTISGILVDTGSYGLRLLSSAGGGALTISLPQQTGSDGNPIAECAPFVSGYTWGPVQSADVTIAGEKAASLPVQVIDPSFAAIPSGCTSMGIPEQDTLQDLGANGILGVGPYAQDCGNACAQGGSSNPGLYYECASSSCTVAAESLAQQVQNPIPLFTTDNNGVILELPSVSGAVPSLSGSMIFGIGTESNNGLGSATVYAINANGEFSTSYNGQSYPAFIDSGSNAYFFLDSATTGLADCSDATGFYCPPSSTNFSALTAGSGSTPGVATSINFAVGNADTLFSNANDFVFSTLGGPNPGMFDWGLPFFFGRNVYTAIAAQNTPAGQGPYWAY